MEILCWKNYIRSCKSFGGPAKLGFSMWLPVLRSGKGPKVFPMSVLAQLFGQYHCAYSSQILERSDENWGSQFHLKKGWRADGRQTEVSNTVDSRYLAPVGSQNSRARVKWFSRYLALSREGHDSRIQDHRPTLPGVYNSQTVCWAIIEVLTFPGSLHTSTSHHRQITTSNIRF